MLFYKNKMIMENKIIAEFMGWEIKLTRAIERNNELGIIRGFLFENLPFRNDWNELIKVVNKISNIDNQADIWLAKKIENFKKSKNINIYTISIFAPIELFYECIIDFIIWYKKLNK